MPTQGKDGVNEIAVFGGGCFWCGEAIFTRLRGVEKVTSGYAGGSESSGKPPTYEEVCGGNTGYAEVVQIEYNSNILSFEQLLSVLFSTHDPTTLNRQRSDVGPQYRSAIFYMSEEQKRTAEKFIKKLEDDNVFKKPIVTELKPLTNFYKAEGYHQQYYENNKQAPYCQIVINPKLEKLKAKYSDLLK